VRNVRCVPGRTGAATGYLQCAVELDVQWGG
jgi:hypothetical protein